MAINFICNPGPLTTVQDLGRFEYLAMGVSRTGAADDLAVRMGNEVLDNEVNAACLEILYMIINCRLLIF